MMLPSENLQFPITERKTQAEEAGPREQYKATSSRGYEDSESKTLKTAIPTVTDTLTTQLLPSEAASDHLLGSNLACHQH